MRGKLKAEKGLSGKEVEDHAVGWDRNFDPLEEARDLLVAREHEKRYVKRTPPLRSSRA